VELDGPVMLATLASAPLDERAVDLAVEVARDHGAALVLVNVIDLVAGGRGRVPDAGDPPELAAALRDAAARAAAAGIPVTTLRGPSPRPLATLLALVAEQRPRLLVFGPDSHRLSRTRGLSPRRHRRATRLLEQRTACLLWTAATDSRVSAETLRGAMAAIGSVARRWPALPRA
jgi:nucleotide-binding universal stress UspA family protein